MVWRRLGKKVVGRGRWGRTWMTVVAFRLLGRMWRHWRDFEASESLVLLWQMLDELFEV